MGPLHPAVTLLFARPRPSNPGGHGGTSLTPWHIAVIVIVGVVVVGVVAFNIIRRSRH